MLGVLSLLVGLLVAGLALPAAAGLGVTTKNAIGDITFNELPASLQSPPLSQLSVIKAADGSNLATFYYENRQSVSLDDVAPTMRQAIVAIEDSRFYEHHGGRPEGHPPRAADRHLLRRGSAGCIDDYPAVRAPGAGRDERCGQQHRSSRRRDVEEPDPQAHRSALRIGARAEAVEGPDPRGLPQHGVLRRRRVWRLRGRAALLRRDG